MAIPVQRLAVNSTQLQAILSRHRGFWERRPEDSFLRSIGLYQSSTPSVLHLSGRRQVTQAERLEPDMLDPALLIEQSEKWGPERPDVAMHVQAQWLTRAGVGDRIPHSWALATIPWLEAILGCPIKMSEGHIWNEHYPGDPSEAIKQAVHVERNPWFQLYLEFLRQLQARVGARFPVSATSLMRGPSDLAAAVMGVQEACMGWLDQPAFMSRLMRACTDAKLAMLEAGYKIVKPFQGGYPNSYALWAPAPVVMTQADHATLVSPKLYKTQILPYDLEVIRCCPASFFHVHSGAAYVASTLVEVPELDVLQMSVDPTPAGVRDPRLVQTLQMILEHKPLMVTVHPASIEDGEWLLAQLPTRGLCYADSYDQEVYETLPSDTPGRRIWLLSQ